MELVETTAPCGEPWPGSDGICCTEPPGHGGAHVRDLGGDVYTWSFEPASSSRSPARAPAVGA